MFGEFFDYLDFDDDDDDFNDDYCDFFEEFDRENNLGFYGDFDTREFVDDLKDVWDSRYDFNHEDNFNNGDRDYGYDVDEWEEGWENLFNVEHSNGPDDDMINDDFALATALGFAEEMSIGARDTGPNPNDDEERMSLWQDKNTASGNSGDPFLNKVAHYVDDIKSGVKRVGDPL